MQSGRQSYSNCMINFCDLTKSKVVSKEQGSLILSSFDSSVGELQCGHLFVLISELVV